MSDCRKEMLKVARLTAEVERWRVKADDLRRLVSAKRIEAERLQGQLAEARAEVERLRAVCSRVVEWSESSGHHETQWYCRVCTETGDLHDLHDQRCPVLACRDALAREDGAG